MYPNSSLLDVGRACKSAHKFFTTLGKSLREWITRKDVARSMVKLKASALAYSLGQSQNAFALVALAKIGSLCLPPPPSREENDKSERLLWEKRLEFLQKQYPIKKPIQLRLSDGEEFSCKGCALGHLGTIVISVPRHLELTEEEYLFHLAHEYSHAFLNHDIWRYAAVYTTQVLFANLFGALRSNDEDSSKLKEALQFAVLLEIISKIVHFFCDTKNRMDC